MIKNKMALFLLISISASIQSMHNKTLISSHSLEKPLEYCSHALREMSRRNITTQDVENVLSTSNQIQKQAYGRTLYSENDNRVDPLKIIVIMTQSKNVVVTAFRKHQNLQSLTLSQRFKEIKNNKRKFGDV